MSRFFLIENLIPRSISGNVFTRFDSISPPNFIARQRKQTFPPQSLYFSRDAKFLTLIRFCSAISHTCRYRVLNISYVNLSPITRIISIFVICRLFLLRLRKHCEFLFQARNEKNVIVYVIWRILNVYYCDGLFN